MEELLYGAAYDLEALPEDRLDYDLMLMKRAGMNVIRIDQPAWSTLEPEEGMYDFGQIDRALDAVDEAQMKAIVGIKFDEFPSWMQEKGKAYHFYAGRLLRRIVERTGRHRCVAGYQLGGGSQPGAGSLPDSDNKSVLQTRPEETTAPAFMDKDELVRMAGIVNACRKPEQFVTSSVDFGTGQLSEAGNCESAGALTVPGCDSYFSAQDNMTGAEAAYQGDCMRGQRHGGGNFYVLGTQAQASLWNTPYPGQLRLQAYNYLSGGADMVMYSRWHSVHSGPGIYWKGVLSQDMDPNPVYGEVRKVGLEWGRIGDRLLHLHKENRAALVTDEASRAAFDRLSPIPECSYEDIVHWLYDSMYELNIECDIVDLTDLDPSLYRMILTPALYSVTERQIFGLRKFVDNGGILVSTFQSFFTDENLHVYADRQPHFMTDVFGMSYQQLTAPGQATVGGQAVECFAELVTAQEAEILAKYQHKYWDGYAAATRNQYGLGKAYYIACMMDGGVLGHILLEAAADAGMITEAMDFEWPVIVRSGVGRYGNRIHYVLHYSEEERDIVCPYEAVELLGGEEYHIGDVLHLKDWDVKVLEEKKRVDDQVTFIQ